MYLLIFYVYVLFLGIVYYVLRKRDCSLAFFFLSLICAMGVLKFSIFTYLYFVKDKNLCEATNIIMECNTKSNNIAKRR